MQVRNPDGILPPVRTPQWPIANRPQLNKLPHNSLRQNCLANSEHAATM